MKKLSKDFFLWLCCIFLWITVRGQVIVTPGEFPSMNQGGGYVTQRTPIVISETIETDFPATGGTVTYVISAPVGYEFLPNTGNLLPIYGCNFNCINISDYYTGSMTVSATTITVTFRFFTVSYIDNFSITNLQARALTGALVTGNVLRTGGTAVQNGNATSDGQVHAILCSANNAIPIITYTPEAYYCNGENFNAALTAAPSGGTWTGSGISGSNFNPNTLTPGTKKIKYTLITGTCYNADSINVLVKSSPTASLSCNDVDNVICAGQTVVFTGNSTGSNKRYQFYKNDVPVTTLSSVNTYSTSDLANGDRIKVVSDNGNLTCSDTSNVITMTVGEYPVAFFKWKNACGTNTVTYTDSSYILQTGSSIVSWNWDVDDNTLFDYLTQATTHTFAASNTYQTRLRVTTDKGCIDDTVVRVYTLPGYTPTSTDPYAINFTSSNQGWAYDGKNSTWGWGIAPSVFGQGTRKLWSTGQNSPDGKYNTAEKSYLYGPCINFSQLDKPMLAIKLSSKITDKPAGAILEVTSDEGLNWIKLGNIDEGLNWYNVGGIVSTPSSTLANSTNNNPAAQGWATDTINFNNNKLSKIGLQNYAGKTSVRFRINFASVADVNAARYAGIAIDSVWIGNRNKIALIEHFTNTGGSRECCLNGDNAIDFINQKRQKDVASIYYHTSIPEYDPINLFNQPDPSSRFLHYGVTDVTTTVLEGNRYKGSIYSGGTAAQRIDTTDIDAAVLANALFKIDLTTVLTTNNVTAKVKLTYTDTKTIAKDVVLHIVVVEDTVEGNPLYNYACRKMLMDAAGQYISNTWSQGTSVYSSQSWTHSLPSNAKLKVVVFIQDAYTNAVYQAAYVKGTGTFGSVVVLSNNESVEDEHYLEVYPNPASDKVNIAFDGVLKKLVNWQMIDNLGKVVKEGIIKEGAVTYQIDTGDLNIGLYYIKIFNEGISQIKKILINK